MAKSFKSTRNLTGGEYKQKLYYVPCADKEEPQVGHEISEPAIFRFLLNEETHLEKFDEVAEVEIAKMLDVLKDIDKQSKITRVEAYRSSMRKMTDALKAFHVFIVFKTCATDGDYWWSLEKNTEYIVLQRSRNKENVKDKFKGEERNKVKLIKEDLNGKGTIKDLFAILWSHQIIEKKYNVVKSNCQSFVTFVSKQITEIGYKFKGNFKYYPPPEKGRDKKMLELINVIRGCSDWSSLFHLIKMGSTDLVDKTVASGKYDINASCNGFTPLHLAIELKKTKMVKHLLQPPMNADPTTRNDQGRNALHVAVSMFDMNAEIMDLLLAHSHVKVDDVDEDGRTALHLAAREINVLTVQKLLEKGANPNIFDKYGDSPLHEAAMLGREAEIFDLLVVHGKVDHVNKFGKTALHEAADRSNVIAVHKLLENGANPNIFDNEGRSPLHVAVEKKDGDAIIDLLLAHPKVKVDDVNEKGETALHAAVSASNVMAVEHLINKGANPNIVDKNGASPLHVAVNQRNGNEIIDLLLEAQIVKGLGDVNDQNKQGRTALHYAAAYSNEITAEHLIKKGANVNCRTNVDDTPLHYAALGAEDMKIIDLLLENINEADIQQYRNDGRLFFFARHNLHGLGDTIVDRLVEKGIQPPCTETADDCTGESGLNTHRFVDKVVDPSIDLTGFDGLDFLITRIKKSLEIDEILKEEEFDINGRNQDGETPLLVAVRANNVNAIRLLLERGADPTLRDENGDTLIHLAVKNCKDCEILNLLLESGKVDINETTEFGWTALHIAIMKSKVVLSHVATALFLLSKEAINPNVADIDGVTPLHMAAKYVKDMNLIDLLLNHPDVDVNLMDNEGKNALDYAMENEHGLGVAIANLLKEKGAVKREKRLPKGNNESLEKLMRTFSHRQPDEIENFLSDNTKTMEDKISKFSEEYLISVIIDSDVETLCRLLKNGADISTCCGEMGENTLHWASGYAKTTDIIDVILETGEFDINGMDNYGRTPLHWAIMGSAVTNARHLIGKGADPDIANEIGITLLHSASLSAMTTELIDFILETGKFDINGVDNNGRTPLHWAMGGYNRTTNARHLIGIGADPDIADKNGVTLLHLAAIYDENAELIDIFRETGKCNINGVDDDGRTPLYYAICGPYCERNVRHLIEKGADPGIADKNGVTPLHMAAKNAESMDLIEVLLNTEAVNVNCVDNEGRSALSYARDNEHGLGEKIIARLKEYGSKN